MTEGQVSNAVHGAVSGPVLQVGTVTGDVNLLTGAPVRTRYRLQVKRIAPPELVDRETELAELASFCTSPQTAGTYAWWRAKAWSGKSALMSTFVLNPPPGVRIVSFFVTARLSGQNDRAAFIDNVLEQLLTLLGDDLPPFLTDATREAHLLGLLTDAAEACCEREEQFVLLVDGLDEDRGVHVDSDSYSIAALLPAEPPAGMRVMVAGRPNPPIPGDVPVHHPLNDPSIVRELTPSPRANAIRESMERELKKLLRGSQIEQDLLGLTTAAGGGLTAADLSELTGETRWQVDEYMRTVTGRSFTRRDSHYLPGASPDVYLLGHEELQQTATEMLGPTRLAEHRERLHAWARRQRAEGWQGTVPEYLLRGYFRMLTDADDVDLMVECATDAVRHDRMLALSGSDATALAEIATTLDALAAQEQPDLVAMTRLAMHRDRLIDRGGDVPVELPALWASVGRVNRAETMAASIKDDGQRAKAFIEVVRATYRNGDADRTRELFDHVEADVLKFASPPERTSALIRLVDCAARCGLRDRATALLGLANAAVREHLPPAGAQTALMRAAFQSGHPRRALQVAETIAHPVARVKALTLLANLAEDLRGELLDQADINAWQITDKTDRETAQAIVARAAAQLDDLERAKRLNKTLGNSAIRAEVDLSLARAAAHAGDLDEAGRIVEEITEHGTRVRAWLAVARAAGTQHASRFLLLARDSERHIEHRVLGVRATTWGSVARTAAEVGLFDLAEQIVADYPDDLDRTQARLSIVRAAAQRGDLERAVRLTRAITGPSALAQAWLMLAKASPEHLAEAELAVEGEPSFTDQVTKWVGLARVAANAGDPERATGYLARSEAVMRKIVMPANRDAELAALATSAARVGDFARAQQLTTSLPPFARKAVIRLTVDTVVACHGVSAAETFVAGLEGSDGLVRLTEVLLERHELAEAERLAGSITDDHDQQRLLAAIAAAIAESGDPDRAVAMWLDHLDRWHDRVLLDPLVVSLDRAGALDRVLPHLPDRPLKPSIRHRIETRQALLHYCRTYGETMSEPSQQAWLADRTDAVGYRKDAWAARCVAQHRAGDTAAVRRLLAEVDDPARQLPSYLIEPIVRVAIEIGDLGWAASACRQLEPGGLSRQVLTLALNAAADSGDFDLVHRIAFRGDHDTSNLACINVVLAEAYVRHGRYDEAMELLLDSHSAEVGSRVVQAATTRGDHVHALQFTRLLPPVNRPTALQSILDNALRDDDLAMAARVAETFTEFSHRVSAVAAIARQAAQNGDQAFVERMLDRVADSQEKAAGWRAIAEADGDLRRRALANAVRLTRWYAVVEQVIEHEPGAFEAIRQEFEAVRD